jgi:hypothetical protein
MVLALMFWSGMSFHTTGPGFTTTLATSLCFTPVQTSLTARLVVDKRLILLLILVEGYNERKIG